MTNKIIIFEVLHAKNRSKFASLASLARSYPIPPLGINVVFEDGQEERCDQTRLFELGVLEENVLDENEVRRYAEVFVAQNNPKRIESTCLMNWSHNCFQQIPPYYTGFIAREAMTVDEVIADYKQANKFKWKLTNNAAVARID